MNKKISYTYEILEHQTQLIEKALKINDCLKNISDEISKMIKVMLELEGDEKNILDWRELQLSFITARKLILEETKKRITNF